MIDKETISNKELLGYYRQYTDSTKEPIPFIDWALTFCQRHKYIKENEHINFCVSSANCGAQYRILHNLALCEFPTANNTCSCIRMF